MLEWISSHQHQLAWMGVISIVVFFVSLLSLPWLVSLIPEDYFVSNKRSASSWKNKHPAMKVLLLIGKNTLGVILICGGLMMLLIPGQGLLTIVIGLLLLDYPGKYTLERKIVFNAKVLPSINWLRRKANTPPLKTEAESRSDTTEPH